MNLEDRIRSSARGQSARYHGADDLFGRIEHRRRQRAARRIATSAAAVVVLFGGGAVGLTSLRDRGGDADLAEAPEPTGSNTAAASTTAASTTTTATTTTTTAATTTTTATTTITTVPAIATSPVQVPVATTAVDANVPMAWANPDGSTGIAEFWMVDQYGSEPVRGSGCGSSGASALPDRIPDGIWAGYIARAGSDDVDIDVACVYLPEAAASVLAGATATTVTADPNYLIVNNSTRTRSMPLDPAMVLRLAERTADGRCVDTRSTTRWADIPPDRQVWVRIHGGLVTWILADCAA